MANTGEKFYMLTTTFSDEKEAAAIAQDLLRQRLIACAQLEKIRSLYEWNGAQEDVEEIRLTAKTHEHLMGQTEEYLRAHHPYEVPQIVWLSFEASADYGDWIRTQTATAAVEADSGT